MRITVGTNVRGAVLLSLALLLAVPAALTTVGAAPAAAQPLIQAQDLTAIQSAYTGEWVSAEMGFGGLDKGMLRARSASIGPWEKYRFVYAGGGAWAIYSFAAQAYVSTELGGDPSSLKFGMLRARAGSIGAWEKYTIILNSDETYSLKSLANGRYVSVELGGSYTGNNAKMLRARANTIGPWEKFYINQSVRSDGYKPVLFIHGYAPPGSTSCPYWWSSAVGYYNANGWSQVPLRMVKYYTGDQGCNFDATGGYPANDNTPILELGRRLAWQIYLEYSRFGVSVDVTAHSMGGLVIRAAITGTETPPGGDWPPYLYVEDVSTLGTPYEGSRWGSLACNFDYNDQQCKDMLPGSAFLNWLAAHPNPSTGGVGPDWTLIASGGDELVTSGSALNSHATVHAGHKILYLSPQGLRHNDLPQAISGAWEVRYCHYYISCNMGDTGSPPTSWTYDPGYYAPVVVAAFGNSYWYLW